MDHVKIVPTKIIVKYRLNKPDNFVKDGEVKIQMKHPVCSPGFVIEVLCFSRAQASTQQFRHYFNTKDNNRFNDLYEQ